MQSMFDKSKSAIRDIYVYFGARDPGELQKIYMNADQTLMRTARWDYKDGSLIPNQITQMIESVGLESIKDQKERSWIQNILWMWYHHAISCALWKYGDKQAAREYAEKAVALQPAGHPNKITRLLYYLTRDELNQAHVWAQEITQDPERTTAQHLLDLYKKGSFSKRPDEVGGEWRA